MPTLHSLSFLMEDLGPLEAFRRPVYCLAGIPVDAVSLSDAVNLVRSAAVSGRRLFLSTPNLNFLIACRKDSAIRQSLIHSDLCVADGMPLVWLARLIGVPIKERVSGSGIFEEIRRGESFVPQIPVYFFGGPDGAAEQACNMLNHENSGACCVGYESPGFGSLADLSAPARIQKINASRAGFLVVSLGAQKGQSWIMANAASIQVPVISHLGAVVNFVAGTVSRAPIWMQRIGLEWAWRIKEEPALWKRYWNDARAGLALLTGTIVPFALWRWRHAGQLRRTGSISVNVIDGSQVVIAVNGNTPEDHDAVWREVFEHAATQQLNVEIDLASASSVSPAFLGWVLVLKRFCQTGGKTLTFVGIDQDLKQQFAWNGCTYLLDSQAKS